MQSIISSPGHVTYEIIVVDDGSDDDCCQFLKQAIWPKVKLVTTKNIGAGQARNLGVLNALGEVLIFCDAHIYVEPYWLEKLLQVLLRPEVGAVSPVIVDAENPRRQGGGLGWHNPFDINWLPVSGQITGVPVLPAGCLAIKRSVYQEIGGFDAGLKKFFHEDMELTTKIWLFGYEALVVPDVLVKHDFKPRSAAIEGDLLFYNMLKIAFYHFNPERINQVIFLIKNMHKFADYMAEIILDQEVWVKRERYQKIRKYDDDWLMSRFKIPF